jgi:glycosyltransferase involved in cell wall biosynthesis
VKAIPEKDMLPPNITVSLLSFAELKSLYNRSRFVVVPLEDTDTDNGITTIEEAMAMGKAVICSRTRGQVDLVRDGVTGLLVPPGNPQALRDAILFLWNNPEAANTMGRAGRKLIEAEHTIDAFVRSIENIVESVILERNTNEVPHGA